MKSSNSEEGRGPHASRRGISPQTLIVASLASAAASFVVARIWGPGTLVGAAAAPVIVALVSETLRRPMQTVSATAKKVPTVPIVSAVRGHTSATSEHPPPGPEDPVRVDTSADAIAWRPRWWMGVVTGLLAFAIVVGVYTVPDLLAGRSITGNGQPTTFFGGSSKKQASSTSTVTTTAPATVTKTATATTTTRTTTTATSSTTTSSAPTSTTTVSTTSTAPPAVSSATTPITPTTPAP